MTKLLGGERKDLVLLTATYPGLVATITNLVAGLTMARYRPSA